MTELFLNILNRRYDFARILSSAWQDRLHLFVKMKKGGYDWVDFKRKVS